MIESTDEVDSVTGLWGRCLRRWGGVGRIEAAFKAILAGGLFFRLEEFFSARSFWHDEAQAVFKLTQTPWPRLLVGGEALHTQPYPAGFWAVSKSVAALLGASEFTVRLAPCIFGVLALAAFARLARRLLSPWAALLSVGLFAFSPQLIYYTSEFKPYSGDVFVTILLLDFFLRVHREGGSGPALRRLGWAGLAGIWLSYPAVMVLAAGVGASVLTTLRRRPVRTLVPLAGWSLVWAAAFLIYYATFIRHFSQDGSLNSFWQPAFLPVGRPGIPRDGTDLNSFWQPAFLPVPSFDGRWFQALVGSLKLFFQRALWLPAGLASFLAVLGVVRFLRRDPIGAWLGILPWGAAVTAATLHRYPFQGRPLLFLFPVTFLLIAKGAECLWEGRPSGERRLSAAVLALWLGFYPSILSWRQFREPSGYAEIKPVMAYLARHRRPDDLVYVYRSSYPAFRYYARAYGLDAGRFVLEEDRPYPPEVYAAALRRLRGEGRVWFLFSDVLGASRCRGDDRQIYLSELRRWGRLLETYRIDLPVPFPPFYFSRSFSAGVYLFDLR